MRKKGILIIVGGIIVCAAAIVEVFISNNVNNNQNKDNQNEFIEESDIDVSDEKETTIFDPILDWWELYNPNGFDTITGVITNPNEVAVDVSYDLVYYKDNEEVARNEYFTNFSIMPGGKSIIWANSDIPEKSKVDTVKMENVVTVKTVYPPINGKYKLVSQENNENVFEFEFEKKPTLATIVFLLYNDKNNNGQFDNGEIVVTSVDSILEQKGRVSFDTDYDDFTSYEVFFTAY